MTSKPSYVAQKVFEYDLVVILKVKSTIKLNKPPFVGMCILELSKVPIYGCHYDYIKNKYGNKSRYYSQILTAWSMKLKLKLLVTILARIKKFLILVNILLSQNITMIQTP